MEQELLTLQSTCVHPRFQLGSCCSIFSSLVFCRSLFVLLSFFCLAIVLSLLQFTASAYPFGIFKLFYQWCKQFLHSFASYIIRTSYIKRNVYQIHMSLNTYLPPIRLSSILTKESKIYASYIFGIVQ